MWAALLVPALVLPAPDAGLATATEVRRGTFVFRGIPGAEDFAAMKRAKITYIISICRDGDPGFDADAEMHACVDLDMTFSRVALKRAPSADDFELFRMVRNSLPKEAKVLVHCVDGNRAAAVVVAWMVAEGMLKPAEAVALAQKAGMVHPDTERAFRKYLGI